MPAKRKEFIVVMLGDRAGDGFGERTLPPLLALVDSVSPDYREVLPPRGIAAFFIASSVAAQKEDQLVTAAEQLRSSDSRFESLGIGISSGGMIADFSWFGRVRSMPLGTVANDASRLVTSAPEAYLSPLTSIRDAYRYV